MGGCGRKGDGGVPSHFDLRQLEHCKTLSVCLSHVAGWLTHTHKQANAASFIRVSQHKQEQVLQTCLASYLVQ